MRGSIGALAPSTKPWTVSTATRVVYGVSVLLWGAAFVWIRTLQSWGVLLVLAPVLAVATLVAAPQARRLLLPTPKVFLWGLAAGVLFAGATYAVYGILVELWPALTAKTDELYLLLRARGTAPVVLAASIVVVACAEELVFRGPILESEQSFRARLPAIAVTSLVAAAAHLPLGSPLLALVVLLCGTTWGILRVLTGSLWPAILCHLVWNAAVLIIWPLG